MRLKNKRTQRLYTTIGYACLLSTKPHGRVCASVPTPRALPGMHVRSCTSGLHAGVGREACNKLTVLQDWSDDWSDDSAVLQTASMLLSSIRFKPGSNCCSSSVVPSFQLAVSFRWRQPTW
ncbi:Hypothetical predicted protein [Pelobates cultripes]|uniref:Uncharacterized protein n=1 Tax=Pelobates cultripes TaxID=61616 RepID=A0AAD1W5D2_PELCU|nr:Hypothetical predicted protein [Pelobates cultripes]